MDDGSSELAAAAAEHWLASQETERAFRASVLARLHADSTGAADVVVRLGERLLALWPLVPGASEVLGMGHGDLFVDVAERWTELIEVDRVLRVVRNGLAVVSPDDALPRAQLLSLRAVAESDSGRVREGRETLEVAMTLLEGLEGVDAARVRAHVRYLLVSSFALTGDKPPAELIASAAAAVGESGTAIDRSELLRTQIFEHTDRGDFLGAEDFVTRLMTIELPLRKMRVTTILEMDFLARIGRFAQAEEAGLRALARLDEVGMERVLGREIRANLAESRLGAGRRVTEAVTELRRLVGELDNHPMFRSFALRLLVGAEAWDGRDDAARALRDREARFVEEQLTEDLEEQVGWLETDLELLLNACEPSRGGEVGRGGEGGRGAEGGGVAAGYRGSSMQARLEGLEPAELAESLGVTARLIAPLARLCGALRDGLGAEAEADATLGLDRLEHLLGLMLAGLHDDDAALAYQALARAECASGVGAGGDPVALWRDAVVTAARGLPRRHHRSAQLRLARELLTGGDRSAAAEVVTEVLAEASAEGLGTVAAWARTLATRARLPAGESAPEPGGVSDLPGQEQLTPRELEVIGLVAEGLSNSQIGARLFISPKTASVHVSAILAKLEVANRTEAAT